MCRRRVPESRVERSVGCLPVLRDAELLVRAAVGKLADLGERCLELGRAHCGWRGRTEFRYGCEEERAHRAELRAERRRRRLRTARPLVVACRQRAGPRDVCAIRFGHRNDVRRSGAADFDACRKVGPIAARPQRGRLTRKARRDRLLVLGEEKDEVEAAAPAAAPSGFFPCVRATTIALLIARFM